MIVETPLKEIKTILVRRKGWIVLLAILAGLLSLVVCADELLDGPLRTWGERTMNANL